MAYVHPGPILLLSALLLLPFFSSCAFSHAARHSPGSILPHAHRHHHKRASAISIVGTVFFDRCLDQQFTHRSSFLPGATVAVECKHRKSYIARVEASTDQYGVFKLELPPSVARSSKRIRSCVVQLVKSPDKFCNVKPASTSSKAFTALNLESKQGTSYIYAAGFLSCQPQSRDPTLCVSNEFKKAESTTAIRFQKRGTDSQSADTSLAFVPPLPFSPLLSPLPIPPVSGLIPPPSPTGFPSIPFLSPPPSVPTIPIFTPPPLIPGLPIPPISFFTPPPSIPGLSIPPIPFVPPLPPVPFVPTSIEASNSNP